MSNYFSWRRKVTSADGQGGQDKYWPHDRYVWGSLEPTTGSKRWEAQQVMHGVSHVIVTHYFSDYTAQSKFVLGTREFKVVGVINLDEENKELVWTCREDT